MEKIVHCTWHPYCKVVFDKNGYCCHWQYNDDHLSLHMIPRNHLLNSDSAYFQFQSHKNDSRVKIIDNAISETLAIECRTLLQSIVINHDLQMINDFDNKPSRKIIEGNREYCASSDVEKWQWIFYSPGIWRLMPADYNTFEASPINQLVKDIDCRFNKIPGFNNNLQPSTWVIQLTRNGTIIQWHRDEAGDRKIAFIYYLTPDDWDYNVHGGQLIVQGDQYITINPTFNRMVMWEMGNSPLHCVARPLPQKQHLRIALVGFYS